MQKFTTLSAIAAPLNLMNVDTDMIIPKQFLKTIKRTGLGIHAFDEMRYVADGSENPDFVLNQAPYNNAEILITGENFGCGSSREHAPWAILDFGIRCIISSSYADIFYNNCFKNGILPIILPKEQVEALMDASEADKSRKVTIDLENQTILSGNQSYDFDIDPFRKHCLMNGLDDIGLTLAKNTEISSFEQNYKSQHPWV
tara:strand:+ start:449107 stop:449709 length:603 start_codon:yes stop_codon:yes gene_type:complete